VNLQLTKTRATTGLVVCVVAFDFHHHFVQATHWNTCKLFPASEMCTDINGAAATGVAANAEVLVEIVASAAAPDRWLVDPLCAIDVIGRSIDIERAQILGVGVLGYIPITP